MIKRFEFEHRKRFELKTKQQNLIIAYYEKNLFIHNSHLPYGVFYFRAGNSHDRWHQILSF